MAALAVLAALAATATFFFPFAQTGISRPNILFNLVEVVVTSGGNVFSGPEFESSTSGEKGVWDLSKECTRVGQFA